MCVACVGSHRFFFRENLFYLMNLRAAVTWLVLLLLQLPWFYTCFQ